MVDESKDSLSHYGVRGMKWGIRRKDDGSGGSSKSGSKKDDAFEPISVEEYKRATANQKTLTGLAASKNLQKNMEKFHDKADNPGPPLADSKSQKREERGAAFDEKAAARKKRIDDIDAEIESLGSYGRDRLKKNSLKEQRAAEQELYDRHIQDAERAREGKLTSGQKKALIAVGVGAVVAGSVAYSVHKQKNMMRDLERKAEGGDTKAKLKLYNIHVQNAQSKTWMGSSYITAESWDREEFELPSGHIFHRISTTNESRYGYNQGTYCTTSEADFNRYIAGFRKEKGPDADFHHVTFKSTKPVKVPNLHTTLEVLRDTLQKQDGIPYDADETLSMYRIMSGGSWNGETAQQFFGNLKSRGYSAIVDEMDAGVIGDKPIVFFDTDAATRKKARRLTRSEIALRERSIELMPRPPRKA